MAPRCIKVYERVWCTRPWFILSCTRENSPTCLQCVASRTAKSPEGWAMLYSVICLLATYLFGSLFWLDEWLEQGPVKSDSCSNMARVKQTLPFGIAQVPRLPSALGHDCIYFTNLISCDEDHWWRVHTYWHFQIAEVCQRDPQITPRQDSILIVEVLLPDESDCLRICDIPGAQDSCSYKTSIQTKEFYLPKKKEESLWCRTIETSSSNFSVLFLSESVQLA